jgi:hypothetical protein
MLRGRIAIAVIMGALSTSAALAQAQPPAVPSPTQPEHNPRDCMPSGTNGLSQPRTNPPVNEQGSSPSTGVICPPPGIDPDISVPPVGGGRTPVIPPPGTPGGDPSVQPK